jgi:hypothetical protein
MFILFSMNFGNAYEFSGKFTWIKHLEKRKTLEQCLGRIRPKAVQCWLGPTTILACATCMHVARCARVTARLPCPRLAWQRGWRQVAGGGVVAVPAAWAWASNGEHTRHGEGGGGSPWQCSDIAVEEAGDVTTALRLTSVADDGSYSWRG